MIAAVGGTTLAYHEVGHGPVCLVLNGGMGTDHTMYRSLDPLGDRLRLVHFDQRGTGSSGRPPPSTLTMAQLADDAADLAGQLGTDRVLVMSHSFGGFVAQELALRYPELVAGLILVGTTAGQLGATDRPGDDQGPPPPTAVAAIMAAMGPEPGTDEELAATIRLLMPHYLHRFDSKVAAGLLEHAVFDAATFRATAALLSTWSVADRLDRVLAPTLLLAGRHDPVCSAAQSYRIARRVPSAEVVVFENSGHFPWLDEPAAFYRVVRQWLAHHTWISADHRSADHPST